MLIRARGEVKVKCNFTSDPFYELCVIKLLIWFCQKGNIAIKRFFHLGLQCNIKIKAFKIDETAILVLSQTKILLQIGSKSKNNVFFATKKIPSRHFLCLISQFLSFIKTFFRFYFLFETSYVASHARLALLDWLDRAEEERLMIEVVNEVMFTNIRKRLQMEKLQI